MAAILSRPQCVLTIIPAVAEVRISRDSTKTFHSWNFICKCLLRNSGHFFQGEMSRYACMVTLISHYSVQSIRSDCMSRRLSGDVIRSEAFFYGTLHIWRWNPAKHEHKGTERCVSPFLLSRGSCQTKTYSHCLGFLVNTDAKELKTA